ncbi:alpha-N-arabinofuranosidase [Levilactobacillus namurensis DSM 19117]|uniref:non-reducing end alpha-L-arabinofuranosidase n=1 Tax=Levilactobacillus namurensis DSM 19117 TaxID=1423773 RepID=A0A0R1JZ54_9LACO|nr:alpha-N-arabinofuranosidase [Levilactobacillus namurensis]KRK76200.1 alpha-N-arabinofuranosidase [Levilactobacillus namurensis DSM 19117]GEO74621.1 alpha-N-arabinofuranosidase [Levilactobacillus namurensis]
MNGTLFASDAFPIAKIDRRLTSSLVEHLGRGVYGGIFDPGNALADTDGYREDVIQAIKELQVPMIRYPGGNFVSGHNWEDGIGPKSQRPQQIDLAWKSIETNQFGLDEFMAWLQKINAQPMMAVNLGTRGIPEACHLLEYCNMTTDTHWANQRRKNGHPEPYAVKTWCLGNEMDANWQIGHKTAHEYGELVNETAKAMKLMDPTIETIVCGSSNEATPTFGKWELKVLDECYDNVDYISMHQYYDKPDQGTMHHIAKAIRMDQFINSVVALCDAAKAFKKSDKVLNISFDEWNVWYHSNDDTAKVSPWQEAPRLLEDQYDFQDALLVGSSLITLLKHADRVKIACFAQLVNVIAPIMTSSTGMFKQTIFYPIMHVSKYARGTVLRTNLQSDHYDVPEFGHVPYLDAIVVQNTDNDYTVFAINRHQTDAMHLKLNLGQARFNVLNHICYQGPNPHFQNSEESQCTPHQLNSTYNDLTLPAFSWNVIRLRKNN